MIVARPEDRDLEVKSRGEVDGVERAHAVARHQLRTLIDDPTLKRKFNQEREHFKELVQSFEPRGNPALPYTAFRPSMKVKFGVEIRWELLSSGETTNRLQEFNL